MLKDQFATEEYRALKSEMLLRIAIQNATILVTVILFVPVAALIVLYSSTAGELAFIHNSVNLCLALQWCHQGVRQCPLKQAVLAHDKAAGRENSWEVWLPSQRPPVLLGSRWFVSTKLVFISVGFATIFLSSKEISYFLLLSFGLSVVTVVVLLTNPKE